jgi:predicted helicase
MTEVTEAESQALLKTIAEHDFQTAFKITAEALGMVHTRRRGLLRG